MISAKKISGTLACLGYTARAKGLIRQAQGYFYQALELVIEVTAIMGLAHALPGIALLLCDLGDATRAVEFYTSANAMGVSPIRTGLLTLPGLRSQILLKDCLKMFFKLPEGAHERSIRGMRQQHCWGS